MSKKISFFMAMLLAASIAVSGCGSTTSSSQTPAPGSESSAASAAEVDYPTKTVEVVYHSGVGSGGDVMLRAMDQALANCAAAGKTQHKGWVINNLQGGSGAVAWEYSADADPDGYTLLGFSSTFITAPLLNEMDVSYEDFTPIAMCLIDPQVVAVPADSPYQTFDELVAAAQENPGQQSWACGVAGSLAYVAGLELERIYEFDANLVPFDDGADASASLMGGHLTAAISEFVEVAEAAKGGYVRILAAFNPLTVEGFEDIPTFEELGHPEIEIQKMRGILGPKGMDDAVVEAIREQLNVMVEEESFQEYVKNNGLLVEMVTGDDFYQMMADQTALVQASLEE